MLVEKVQGGGVNRDMLQARSSEGKLITLAKLTKAEIEFHRKKTKFYCPRCNHPVMIKSGPKTIPHFAHYSQSNCPSRARGEGPYHQKGKLILYQWLKRQNLNVALEKYLKEIDQQPDLYVTINHKRIAIEFQCARTNIRDVQKRNAGYMLADIIPIWILGANLFDRKGRYQLKVDQFILQFVHQFSNKFPIKLYFFCPNSLQMVTFEDLYFIRQNRAIGRFRFYKLKQINFTILFQKNLLCKRVLYNLWKEEKRKFRLQPRKFPHGQTKTWLKWLYLQNIHIENLPSIVHLPISSQYLMKSPLWNWQSRLCIQVIQARGLGSVFTKQICLQVISNHLHEKNHLPLIQSSKNPVSEYLKLLKQLNYIKKVSNDMYKIIKKVQFHKHIEQSLTNDILIMDQLIDRLS